ncbi:MAG: 4Fe-4S dicluster domain-containing protein [Candidatus Omnitrophica bacterium]|nr:4Fe-4S dicluster domain-containing protein [Candidatus Omnitrophota bacterium]
MKRLFVDVERCLSCRSCEIACAVEHSQSKDLFSSLKEEPGPRSRTKVERDTKLQTFPLQCRHCEEPYCIDACISGAVSKDPETGLVILDEDKCVGCWMCVMVCPFGVIRPAKEKKIALRCDLCQDNEIPACVAACPTKALFFGELKDFKKKLLERKDTKSKVKV